MNIKLLKELSKQAETECGWSEEKFAELVVRECASMAKAFHNHGYDFTGDLELDEFMLKHFGVES